MPRTRYSLWNLVAAARRGHADWAPAWREAELRAAYGILIHENGVVFDDGIVARLAPDRFWVNTTSGGVERVALAFDALPYGVEALMVMRTEKGYLHVGGDTDGTTLPGDIGMDRGIGKKAANFVGRRSLLQPAARDENRMQLVGLAPVDRQTRLPVGAHAVAPPGPPGQRHTPESGRHPRHAGAPRPRPNLASG